MPGKEDVPQPTADQQLTFNPNNKYIAPWIMEGMDKAKITPEESYQEVLDRILKEEHGLVTKVGERIAVSPQTVHNLLGYAGIDLQDYPREAITQSQSTRKNMSKAALERWQKERRKKEAGLPSLSDLTHSPEAEAQKRISTDIYWSTEEGRKRKEKLAQQTRAEADKRLMNRLGNNPAATLSELTDSEGITKAAQKLRSSPNVTVRCAQGFGLIEDGLFDPNYYIVKKASKSGLLSDLDARARYIMEACYLSEKPLTHKQIGNRFGIKDRRVYQIKKAALQYLRKQLSKTQKD